AELRADLTPQIQIGESQVRRLYQQVYLSLLACHERQHHERLAQAAAQHGGLVLALDGLAPEGGEPQLWCIRELLTGVVLRSGWLSGQDQATFEGFLQPLRDLIWPIRAIVSDKQRGLLPAIASVLPTTPHQFCQSHYLRNLAEPLASADSALTVSLRQAVRQELGPLLRVDQPPDPALPGVLTMTGLLLVPPVAATPPAAVRTLTTPPSLAPAAPEPVAPEPVASEPVASEPVASEPVAPDFEAQLAAEVVTQLLRRTRYLLTLKGRPPLRLAGMETYAELQEVIIRGQRLLAHRDDPQLAQLVAGLQAALAPLAARVADVQVGADWLARISTILSTAAEPAPTAAGVAQELQTCLEQLEQEVVAPDLVAFRQHLQKVSRSYWPGLFHCYDHPDIPRTNNGMESLFRDTQRRILRTTGQKGRTRRILHRLGAWEVLGHPPTEADCLSALRQIAPSDLVDEQQRMRQHGERFRLHTRAPRQTKAQLDRLEQRWLALPPTATA
ncbi:MAG: transposase, partial [Oscillochloris sp.]|nr:transposase [Oscillochloris sp.]